ncbi:MAG: RagB/SusD family nutrient uptake outer membrane protein [Dysgonamonadaceae bacterium]|nr:RagB/SusD family nutrient uptake outer membrane protein [Dysgonamonadaceae bacterium]
MKKIVYICIFASCLLISGCNEWLDILPKNEQVTADYWKAKEDVEAMLASGYYYMCATTPQLIEWGELRGASILDSRTLENMKIQNFQLTASSSLCKWNVFYQVINMANSVIKYAPAVQAIDETYSEAAMKSHQTEAYFMRALMYFYLVRNFKEVPLVIEPYVDDSAPYKIAKSTEETIIAQIKADIKTALDSNAAKEFYDDDAWIGANKGRVSKWAFYALMADVCLWSEDYDNSIIYADLLINATATWRPVFMLIPEQWFTIFYPGNSNESIFEFNWDNATYGTTKGSPSNYFTVATDAQYQYSPAMIERLEAETREVIQEGKTPIRTLWGAYAIPAEGSEIHCIWKYQGQGIGMLTAARTSSDANYIIYRMADVMLMKAEALIWKGQSSWPEALEIMNKIRNRSYLNDLDVSLEETDELAMLEVLLNERDIELAGEGKRWYDLLRFGKSRNYKYKSKFIEMITDNNSSANDTWLRSVLKNEYAWYLPISQSEIEVNDLLVQNSYYQVTNK